MITTEFTKKKGEPRERKREREREREREIKKEKKVLFAEIKLFYRKTTMTNLFKKLQEFSTI